MKPIRDIAKQLGCCRETVRRMLRENKIPGAKIRGVWKADPDKVIVALSNHYSSTGTGKRG